MNEKKMKILLVSPPSSPKYLVPFLSEPVLPIGLCYLAAVLEKDGHDVIVRDYTKWTNSSMKKDIKEINPELTGISCLTLLRMNSYKFARTLKKIVPNTRIIFGGSHATFFPEHVFELTKAEFVVFGEGERTMSELVSFIKQGRQDYENILGLVYKDKKGVIRKNAPRPRIENLDELPFPNFDDFDLSKQKAIPVISSRGCVFACNYCSTNRFWGRYFRGRTAKNVVDEIELRLKTFKTNEVTFWDDNFALVKKRTMEICDEIIKRGLKIKFKADARVDGIDEELLKKLKEAGCECLIFGLESASPIILKNINKGYSIEHAKKQLALAKKYVKVIPLLMMGNKGESNDTIDETATFIHEVFPEAGAPIHYAPVYVFPNSYMYDELKAKGVIGDDYWKKKGVKVYTEELSEWQLFLLRDRYFAKYMSRFSFAYLLFIRNNVIRNVFGFFLG